MDLTHFPLHLLLPLSASILFAFGLLLVKQAGHQQVNAWTITLVTNTWAAILFSSLWLLGGASQPWSLYWQPAVVALLYFLGQIFTFLAIRWGDLSVAAPLLSTKVVMVTAILAASGTHAVTYSTWSAAMLASLGVGLIQTSHSPAQSTRRAGLTAFFAILAAVDFAIFDCLVQRWSPAWGPGRFLPPVFWMGALLTLTLLPFANLGSLRGRVAIRPTCLGGLLIAFQSLLLVLALGFYGDAARVNVVYSLRGVWGVAVAWIFARWLGGGESSMNSAQLRKRFAGAILVTIAVAIAVGSR